MTSTNRGLPLATKSKRNIEVRPARVVTADELTITRIVDNPARRTVRAFVSGLDEPIVILDGDTYGTDWTYADVVAAVAARFAL